MELLFLLLLINAFIKMGGHSVSVQVKSILNNVWNISKGGLIIMELKKKTPKNSDKLLLIYDNGQSVASRNKFT